MWTLFWTAIASLSILSILGIRSNDIAGVYVAVWAGGAVVGIGLLGAIVHFLP